jgi:spore germination protein
VQKPKPMLKKEDKPQVPLYTSLSENLDKVRSVLGDSNDIVIREFVLGTKGVSAALLYVDGLINKDLVCNNVLESVMIQVRQVEAGGEGDLSHTELFSLLERRGISMLEVKTSNDFDRIFLAALSGEAILFLDGVNNALVISARGWEHRTVQEPQTQTLIRGPRLGFTETLRVNTSLLRRYLRDPNLKLKTIYIGRRSKTEVCVAYLETIANPTIVDEVNKRLATIDVDAVMESGYIEQHIQEDWLSPFPQLQSTERPDHVVLALLQGKVAILIDNTPFALMVPVTVNDFFISPEDYYERWTISTLVRLIRYLASFMALILPALYIALVSFHPEMIPTKLVLSLAAGREGVPLSAFLEALVMLVSFELLREAGIRLPGPIGQTIGIVGGLIVGQAAVAASIVSPLMIIVIAFTGISSFAIPNYSMAIALRILTLPLMIFSAVLGLYGFIMGLFLIGGHLAALKSFGVPLLSPFSPLSTRDLRDTLFRHSLLGMHRRPELAKPQDQIRMQDLRDDGELAVEEKKKSLAQSRPRGGGAE